MVPGQSGVDSARRDVGSVPETPPRSAVADAEPHIPQNAGLRADVKEELRQLLRREAILYSTPAQPITHRNGEPSDWAYYSWHVTLTERGLRLAAHALLQSLQAFESTQLASVGYTGLPLLSACILEGRGRYTGLSVREKRKPYLTNRRVDGVLDRSRPVVVIDDSLSSGTSLHKAITALEDEGLEVEGSIALVHFPYRGAKEWANAAGYRTVTLFDIWQDLGMAAMDGGYRGAYRERGEVAVDVMPEGLSPPELARRVAEYYLRTERVPRWPSRLDAPYDARGGTYVSLRQHADDSRAARDGFWHFDPSDADAARDVVLATVDTLQRSGALLSLASLDHLKFGVSFFGPLEEIAPSRLDFDRYGIVARSTVWPDKLGGALPNTQVFISDIEQYRHARETNAGIEAGEPHALYRHTIHKVVEAGHTWPSYGCEEGSATSWWRDEGLGRLVTERARQTIAALCAGATAPRAPLARSLPIPIEGVAITVYVRGVVGYGLSYAGDLAGGIAEAAQAVCEDSRFAAQRAGDASAWALVVSVLHSGEALEGGERWQVERKIRRGLDAVSLEQGGERTSVLPSALVYNNWSRADLLDALEDVAGGKQPRHAWRTHQVAAWVSQVSGVRALRFGFPAVEAVPVTAQQVTAMIDLLAGHVFRAIDAGGIPAYSLCPTDAAPVRRGTAGRVVHALYTLRIAGVLRGRADWMEAAVRGVEQCLASVRDGMLELDEHVGGPLAEAVLLTAGSVCGFEHTTVCRQLAQRVADWVHDSGWIGAGVKRLDNPQDQEFLPGAVAWAIANYCRAAHQALPPALAAARRFYARRLSEYPTWGSPWLAQGWSMLHAVSGDAEDAAVVYGAADWAMAGQLEKNGAFLETLSPHEPSFNAGFIAEGLAGAWRTAQARGDLERAHRYAESWRKAMGFVRTLMLDTSAVFAFRCPEQAVGGVRCTLSRSDLRIDQVSHALHALVEGAQLGSA
jgi:orotate phosphoribosyltransferase/AMMECR1 domain-containing protein